MLFVRTNMEFNKEKMNILRQLQKRGVLNNGWMQLVGKKHIPTRNSSGRNLEDSETSDVSEIHRSRKRAFCCELKGLLIPPKCATKQVASKD